MADYFSFLSDSDDERAVEDVLSQAMDHSVLEQIAAINCSSFSTSDNLPSHLETRFRKLKSLPATLNSAAVRQFPPAKSKSFKPQSGDDLNRKTVDFDQVTDPRKFSQKSPIDSSDEHSDEYRDEKKATKPNWKPKSSPNTDPRKFSQKSSPIDSPEESDEYIDEKKARKPKSSPNTDPIKFSNKSTPIDSPEEHPDEKKATKSKRKPNPKPKSSSDSDSNSEVCKQKDLKSKSKPGTGSPFDSWTESLSPESDSGTLSPPPRRSIGCLWCSPKKEKSVSKKHGKENRLWSSSSLGSDYDSEILKSFSIKEQKKIMKKAMKEEEKINREAEKIVKWAKQASARMMDVNVTGLDDHLSYLEK